jgi:hypothetical protein
VPNYLTAKTLAERSLRTIGAFPPSQSQADSSELQVALQWLEMILNDIAGRMPLAGLWQLVDIPLEAGVGDYLLSDYVDDDQAQHVFSVGLVNANGDVDPLEMMFENQAAAENLQHVGTPCRVVVTRDVMPRIKVYPEPTQANQDAGLTLRLRIQTYANAIDARGIADSDTRLRPSWYLWAVKANAYEIGSGPVRRLPDNELDRFQKDAMRIENALGAFDGQQNTGSPPVTDPCDY